MSTLVVCLDRGETVAAVADEVPVVGERAVRSLVTEAGLHDPESSRTNCFLEGLRVARDLRETGENPVVAVVSGADDSVDADRAVARQIDELLAAHDIDSSVVVTDSADEGLVHVVESRVRVDGVSRVVVRQSRDLESTYHYLKQFLDDEELRQTVLVPIGIALLAAPVLVVLVRSAAVAVAVVAAVTGLFLLYKGFGVDDAFGAIARGLRGGFYTGRVSVVTGVIAAGLGLVGVVAGGINASPLARTASPLVTVMAFLFASVPWLATAALTASIGLAADEWLANDRVRTSALNLPFVAVAVALVVRGFAAYFLERAGVTAPLQVPALSLGVISVRGFAVTADTRLLGFVLAGVLVTFVGVGVAARIGTGIADEPSEQPE